MLYQHFLFQSDALVKRRDVEKETVKQLGSTSILRVSSMESSVSFHSFYIYLSSNWKKAGRHANEGEEKEKIALWGEKGGVKGRCFGMKGEKALPSRSRKESLWSYKALKPERGELEVTLAYRRGLRAEQGQTNNLFPQTSFTSMSSSRKLVRGFGRQTDWLTDSHINKSKSICLE